MIIEHKHFGITDKPIIEKIKFKPPIKLKNVMENEACFFYAINASGSLHSPGGFSDINTQEGVLAKCGSYVGKWKKSKKEEIYEVVVCHFYPELIEQIYLSDIPEIIKSKKVENKSLEKVKVDSLIQNYIDSLLFYFQNPSLIDDDLLLLKIKELILLLVKSENQSSIISIIQSFFIPEEYKFKQIIESHLFDNITMDELAFLCNMSLSTFKRKFKELYNNSPANYIREQRLEKSKEILVSTDNSIADIAYDVGFSEPGHFTKSFRSFYGKTPKEFRLEY